MSQLIMRREDLLDLPEPQLCPGMRIRRATVADADSIALVLSAAFEPEARAPATAEEVISRLFHSTIVCSVLVVVDDSDKVVATTSAAYIPWRFGDVGYVHWVAADPAHAGAGLGAAVLAATLHEFSALGLVAAVLETDDHRLPAIVTYIRLGFRPFYYSSDHPARWAKVLSEMASRGK